MADRIYTQADYDKVTDLYNEYQTKRDSYTPEQQQQIENAFGNAWSTMSNRIIESNNRVVDMWNDEQGNSWQMYGDGRKEMVNAAPTPQPAPTQQKATRRTPTNNDEELYGLGGYLKEDTQAWEQQKNNPPTGTRPTGESILGGENIQEVDLQPTPTQPGYTTGPITGRQFRNPVTIGGQVVWTPTPNFSGDSILPNNLQHVPTIDERLAKYSPQFQADIKRILSSGGNISADGFVHRADGSVVTKI